MEAGPTREQVREIVADKLEASEARIETAVGGLSAKIDHLPTTWQLIGTVAAGFGAILALVIGILTFGNEKFDSGSSVASGVAETRQLTQENAKQIQQLSVTSSQLQQSVKYLIERSPPATSTSRPKAETVPQPDSQPWSPPPPPQNGQQHK